MFAAIRGLLEEKLLLLKAGTIVDATIIAAPSSRDRINAAGSRVRSYVEHPFQVVKGLWCFTKVRYRGLLKNTTRAYATLALANLYRLRHRLMLQGT